MTNGQSASQSWRQAHSGAQDRIFVTISYGFVDVGRPLSQEDRSVVCRDHSQYVIYMRSHFAS
jgi:hypothetical protein